MYLDHLRDESPDYFPDNKILKRMGFLKDQEGIMRRYLNDKFAWEKHLKNTKDYIMDNLPTVKGGVIAILGSGWLLDVPVEFLLSNYSEVHLYDIRHPVQIKHKYREEKNIRFFNMDISGGAIAGAYKLIKKSLNFAGAYLEEIPVHGFRPRHDYDCVVSVNLLSQLDILVIEYLRKKTRIEDIDMLGFRRIIQEAHLDSLPRNKSIVIADYKEVLFNRLGEEQSSLVHVFTELPSGENTQEWFWDFDTRMTYYPNRITKLMVKAFTL